MYILGYSIKRQYIEALQALDKRKGYGINGAPILDPVQLRGPNTRTLQPVG